MFFLSYSFFYTVFKEQTYLIEKYVFVERMILSKLSSTSNIQAMFDLHFLVFLLSVSP